jgi:Uncharacterized protein conserved in bacteria (DUF2188)
VIVKEARAMARLRLTVTPDKQGGGWKVEGAGAAENFRTKDEAIRAGRNRAKAADLGQLVVKGRNGRIQTEHTYGKDPRRTKG